MRTTIETSRSLSLSLLALLVVVGCVTATLSAAGPPPLPPGMGKYVMVLWPPGTPVPGEEGPGRKNDEPDVEKMGGRVLYQRDNRRIIHLPAAAAKQLWRHQSVVYLQRIWNGESLEGWDERYSEDESRTGPKIGTDHHLQWGPKAYAYDGSGNIKQIGSDAYVYDTAGRLVETTVSGKTQRFKYDAFGNLVETAVVGANAVSIPVDGSSNRLLGRTYDESGNVIVDEQQRPFQFDSLNILTRVGDRRMIYDAADERIGTLIGWSLARWTIRDLDGQIIREYKGENQIGVEGLDWYWEQDHIRGAGQLLAGETQQWKPPYSPPTTEIVYGGVRHYHLDHLGSVRMVTDSEGRSLSEHDYLPFGKTLTRTYQEEYNWGNPHIDGMRFAGHWRDFLGHLNVENHDYIDYMHARYYDPALGRFLSVDPGRDWDMHQPQSWNMYSYVRNNPINTIDPTGKWGWSDFKNWVRQSRADISNWWSEKWHKDIPPPPDQYGGVEALEAAGLAPEDAQQMGNPQANWANARAEAGAILSDEATTEAMSWGVGKVAGAAVVVIFSKQAMGHGARHLVGSGLSDDVVEQAIEREVQFVARESSQTGSFWGRINVEGRTIQFKAHTLPDGRINVGTYWEIGN